MNRRGFLGSIIALGAAPAIVRADSLMRIVPRDTGIVRVVDSIQFYESGLYWYEEVGTITPAAIERLSRLVYDEFDTPEISFSDIVSGRAKLGRFAA